MLRLNKLKQARQGAKNLRVRTQTIYHLLPAILLMIICVVFMSPAVSVMAATESGSVGVEGKISSPPPTRAATITFPANGSTINQTPVTVTGLCPEGLLVKVFNNNIFAGAAVCKNGSYSVKVDLFSGKNELVARVYDSLDQAGPDSNKVVVTLPAAEFGFGERVSVTSTFARKGADPGKQLIWPIAISGGSGPYAITVDWGDGKAQDIISRQFAGQFDISHVYDTPGIYTIIIRVADSKGNVAFLQLVGVANGEVAQASGRSDNSETTPTVKIIWWPLLLMLPLSLAAFWLGRKHELFQLRKKLRKT